MSVRDIFVHLLNACWVQVSWHGWPLMQAFLQLVYTVCGPWSHGPRADGEVCLSQPP